MSPGSLNPLADLYLEVDTFADPQSGEGLAELAERLWSDVIEPVAPVTAGRAQPFFTMKPTIGSSSRRYRPTKTNWQLLVQRFRDGKIGEFVFDGIGELTVDRAGIAEGGRSILLIEATLRERSLYTAGWARSFSVRCSPDLLGGEITRDVQRRWIELGHQMAAVLRAATGYLTLDNVSGGDHSPYERVFGIQDGLATAREFARGYYWGTYLGSEQVGRLGGVENVERLAPCYAVRRLAGDSEPVFLQLTEDIRLVTDEDLRALWRYLKPVLRAGELDPFQSDIELRILKESPE